MTDETPAPVAKTALRARARVARDAVPADQRARASAAIAARVDDVVLAALPAGATVGLYAAIHSEVDTADLAARAVARGLSLAYPRVIAGTRLLAFHRVAPAALRPGTLSIPEPLTTTPLIAPIAIAAFILPGLAFDGTGARLGWGRGHYDATLIHAPGALRVGLAFESQLVDRLPVDPSDQHVHLIITEVATHDVRPVPGP